MFPPIKPPSPLPPPMLSTLSAQIYGEEMEQAVRRFREAWNLTQVADALWSLENLVSAARAATAEYRQPFKLKEMRKEND